jgi:outer membrane protein TolC
LTSDVVARRAALTSYSVAAAREALAGARARLDQARILFFPRVTGTARYTRLSNFTQPSLVSGEGTLVGTKAAAGTPNPPSVALPDVRFSNVLDNYYFAAGVLVPVSDYFLRLNFGYDSAAKSKEAARLDAIVARAQSATDGRVVFYTWLRARESIGVAEQALADQRTHLADVQALSSAGLANIADVLRARSLVSSAELGVTDSKRDASVLERQVRTAIHANEDEALVPGEHLQDALPPIAESASALIAEARASRLEVRSLDASIAAAHSQAHVARAAIYPSVSLFADGIDANPNPRYIPASNTWLGTWDAGVVATWSPNDVPLASAAGSDADAKARELAAHRGVLLDSINIEVQKAYEDTLRGDAAIGTSEEELTSATQAYRVAREGLLAGRVTPTTLTDVEIDLARARLDLVDARSDARIARARLSFATGRATRGQS